MRRRSIGRKQAEDILEGRSEPNNPVGRVLAAARAPAEPEELAGIDTAAAAFASAAAAATDHPGDVISAPHPPHGAPVRTLVAGTTTRKIIAAAAAVAAAGGIAVAVTVSGGSEPAPHPSISPSSSSAAPSTPPSSSAAPTSTHPASSTTPTPSGSRRTTAAGQSRRDLCRSWLHASASARIQEPQFRVLITAAGGVSRVELYCTRLLAGISKPPPVRASPLPTSIVPSTPRVRVSTPRVRVSTPHLP